MTPEYIRQYRALATLVLDLHRREGRITTRNQFETEVRLRIVAARGSVLTAIQFAARDLAQHS